MRALKRVAPSLVLCLWILASGVTCENSDDCDNRHWMCEDQSLCLPLMFRCDGQTHCDDDSDERGCPGSPQEKGCVGDKFQCENGECINKDYLCDMSFDCTDGSDERNCTGTNPCNDQFQCKNGHCIINPWRCDGADDCGDNSDEENCPLENCEMEDGYYMCKNLKECIKVEQVCNGNHDCSDKSDEGGNCHSEKSCSQSQCSHACINTPDGHFCVCSNGLARLNKTHCEDIDECFLNHALCSQKCHNSPGAYKCSCAEGYDLQKDNHTCKVSDGEALVVFASSHHVMAYNVEKRELSQVSNVTQLVVGVAYDGKYVYWSDVETGSEGIFRSHLNGSNRVTLVNHGIDTIEDISIDWYTGNIYFTDSGIRHIGVCSNDGSHCAVIINKAIDKPRAIVLNPAQGEMYWTDWGSNPEIAKSNMDGSLDTTIVSKNLHWPNGLTMDYPSDRLYWVDGMHQRIETVKPDGSHRKVVKEIPGHHPYGIAVFEDTLYWGDWKLSELRTCNKRNGADTFTPIHHMKINGIHIHHPSMITGSKNPCLSSRCTHLCLLAGKSFSCACPEGMILKDDGLSCKSEKQHDYLLIGANNMLMRINHQPLGRQMIKSKSFSEFRIDGLVYDSNKDQIIVYDDSLKKIFGVQKYFQDDHVVKILAQDRIQHIEAMDLDGQTDTLYWCDSQVNSIEVLALKTLKRSTLMVFDTSKVTSIALVPQHGFMFFAMKIPSNLTLIVRVGMDGETDKEILPHHYKSTMLKLHYVQGALYIANVDQKRIETVTLNDHLTEDSNIVFRNVSEELSSITTMDRKVFWMYTKSDYITWAKSSDYSGLISRKEYLARPITNTTHLVGVRSWNDPIGQHTCQKNNGNCSDICLQKPSMNPYTLKEYEIIHVCECQEGSVLSSDNKTCTVEKLISSDTCPSNKHMCIKGKECIEKSKLCDGKNDCSDASDETPEVCKSKELASKKLCTDKKCEYNCTVVAHIAMCSCPEDHLLAQDGFSCKIYIEKDTCGKNSCDQKCIPKGHSYTCDCYDGFSLMRDKKSCKADGESASILYFDEGKLQNLSLFYGNIKSLAHDPTHPIKPTGLTIFSHKKLVLYSVEEMNAIQCLDLTTEKIELIPTLGHPIHLSVDWIVGNVYFVNENNQSINVCNVEKKRCSIILNVANHLIVTALAVDPINRWIFYATLSSLDSSTAINKVSLDGTHKAALLISDDESIYSGLAFDYEKKILYFSDKYHGELGRIKYDKTDEKLLIADLQYPESLEVFENRIYFMQDRKRELIRCKLGVKSASCMTVLNVSPIEQYTLSHPSKQKLISNPCDIANCTHLCVQALMGPKCLCSDGKEIDQNLLCENIQKPINPLFTKTDGVSKSGNASTSVVVILICLSTLIVGTVFLYKCQKKRLNKSMERDVSVHFHNPDMTRDVSGFNIGFSSFASMFPTFSRPVQTEYTNPMTTKIVPTEWPPNITIDSSDSHLVKNKTSRSQLEVPKRMADSDSDVESDRDFHDGNYKDTSRFIP